MSTPDGARLPRGLPARTEGPWQHDSGYPLTWSVVVPGWTLCDCPREDVAERLAELWNAAAASRATESRSLPVAGVKEEQ